MLRYFLVAVAAVCFALFALSAPAAAGCSDECSKDACAKAKSGEKVKSRGTIKYVDRDKGVFVLCPEGTTDEIRVKTEKSYIARLGKGDKVIVDYLKGEPCVATRVLKRHEIKRMLKPCVECLPGLTGEKG